MKAVAVLKFCIVLAALLPARAEHSLSAVTQPAAAEVTIDRLQDGRRLIRLPAVEFPLRVAPACPMGQTFRSLSISVADTHRTFDATDFATDAVIETTMRIPGRQIGPLAVDNFCVDAADKTADSLRIGDAFTATVSIRCDAESQDSVIYDSVPLDLVLVCTLPGNDNSSDAESAAKPDDDDQDSSSALRF